MRVHPPILVTGPFLAIAEGHNTPRNVPLGKANAVFTSIRKGQSLPNGDGLPARRSENQ